MAIKVTDFEPQYLKTDVGANGYVTPEAFTVRNTPPPIKAMIGGEAWYLDRVDILSFEKVAANRFNIETALGSGFTISANAADYLETV